MCSPGLIARLGVLLGGRVKKLRAVEDPSAPIPKEITSKLGGALISSDARSKGQPWPLPLELYERLGTLGRNIYIPTGDQNQPSHFNALGACWRP
jgi:hypothetical protein